MQDVAPLVAFGFANWALLGWLAAASAPLLIHLWNRRKYREVPWAAMQFVLAALRRNARRMRLEQFLLLATRTSLIALLVFALAQPLWEPTGSPAASGQRTHRVLILDGSYSMGFKPSDKSVFDRAKELAGRIIEAGAEGDGYTLILMAPEARVLVGSPAFHPAGEVAALIQSLEPPHAGADVGKALAAAENILDTARKSTPGLEREEIYFLTDLGRTSWSIPPGAGQEELAARCRRLSERASLVVLDLGQASGENLAVTDVRAAENFATLAREVAIQAEIRNFGRQSRPRQLVELYVDGRRVADEYLDLDGEKSASVAFAHRFTTPGEHQVEVRLAADLLDIDNHRWLSLPVRESLRVLCVDGHSAGSAGGGATEYLRVALAPRESDAPHSPVQVVTIPESSLDDADLAPFDAVFLCDVGQFSGQEARLLEAYVRHGGGLVFFLGERVQAERYNGELAGQAAGGARLLPALVRERVRDDRFVRFDPLGYRHPIIKPFQGFDRSGLLDKHVRQYFRLEIPPDWAGSERVLNFEGGDPAVVSRRIGRGRTLLFATSADADVNWSLLPASPVFPSLVQETLAASVAGQFDSRNVLVGETIGSSLPTPANDAPLVVRGPTGESATVRLDPDGEYSRFQFGPTLVSGVHTAQLPAPAERNELFAVNVNTIESDLTKTSAAELAAYRFDVRSQWRDLDSDAVEPVTRTESLHVGLLYVVLALVFVELWLAARFAPQRGAS